MNALPGVALCGFAGGVIGLMVYGLAYQPVKTWLDHRKVDKWAKTIDEHEEFERRVCEVLANNFAILRDTLIEIHDLPETDLPSHLQQKRFK